jgi:quercetin dioxygenase-like cupin family protein
MRIYSFAWDKSRPLERFGSRGAQLAPVCSKSKVTEINCIYLEPLGIIGTHEAELDKLLLVVRGHASVTGAEGQPVRVGPGSAVYWERGEMHETRAADDGLIAIVLEGARLYPERNMPRWLRGQPGSK